MASLLRFASFHVKESNKNLRIGLIYDNGSMLDLTNGINREISKSIPGFSNIFDVIENKTSNFHEFKEIMSIPITDNLIKSYIIPSTNYKLLAPIISTRNVMCVGKNYLDHINEVKAKDVSNNHTSTSLNTSNNDLPKFPQFFTKASDSIISPHEAIESHVNITKYLDFEAELAVIIGKSGRDIEEKDALDYVYGYTIGNDITARDIQRKHIQWFKGKTLDKSCPLGPYLVPRLQPTLDNKFIAIDDTNLSIKLWLNNELMQSSNTSKMIFNVSSIINHLSSGFTLKVGDIILSGTPDGVGYARNPPICLKTGDHVKIEIDYLGTLENTVN